MARRKVGVKAAIPAGKVKHEGSSDPDLRPPLPAARDHGLGPAGSRSAMRRTLTGPAQAGRKGHQAGCRRERRWGSPRAWPRLRARPPRAKTSGAKRAVWNERGRRSAGILALRRERPRAGESGVGS